MTNLVPSKCDGKHMPNIIVMSLLSLSSTYVYYMFFLHNMCALYPTIGSYDRFKRLDYQSCCALSMLY